jgi:cytochrome P450
MHTTNAPQPLIDALTRLEAHARRALGAPERAPGPPRAMMPWELGLFFSDQLGYIERAQREWGDVSYIRFANMPIYQVTDPELIERVLVKESSKFMKDGLIQELKRVLGEGLLTSQDPLHRRQRKLAAPALKRRQIASYADAMVARTAEWCARVPRASTVNMHEEMMAVTLEIVVETLFGVSLDEDARVIGQALEDVLDHFQSRIHSPWRLVPESIPTPTHRRFVRALEELDEVVYGLIARREAAPEEGDDLLVRLLRATDEDGQRMSRTQLRDEVITMFLAGHETTALAVTFAWHHLATHPALAARIREEVEQVLGDRPGTADDVRALPFTEAVVKETMRLTPPAWIIGRQVVEELELGGHVLPVGSTVIMPQWVVHRDARWYDAPLSFDPDRWLDGRTDDLPRFAYYPFGGGPRVCIGNHFAMMEAILMIATMAQHLEISAAPTTRPMRFVPAVTMRPAEPVNLAVR